MSRRKSQGCPEKHKTPPYIYITYLLYYININTLLYLPIAANPLWLLEKNRRGWRSAPSYHPPMPSYYHAGGGWLRKNVSRIEKYPPIAEDHCVRRFSTLWGLWWRQLGVDALSYWAVVTTHPQCEAKAQDHLKRQGFECYAPRTWETRVQRGRKTKVVSWLFPRYLFILVADQWRCVLGTIGVSTLLRDGDNPARLPAAYVDAMKQREQNGFIVLPRERYRRGQRIRISSGSFQGCLGLYHGMTSRQREVVLLDSLGRVELAAGDLA